MSAHPRQETKADKVGIPPKSNLVNKYVLLSVTDKRMGGESLTGAVIT